MRPIYFFLGSIIGGGEGDSFCIGGLGLFFLSGNGGGGTFCRPCSEGFMLFYLKKLIIKNVTSNAIPISKHAIAIDLIMLSWVSHSL